MSKYPTPILIAFDFDGTLYPLRPYDSEQRLLLKATRQAGTLKRAIAKRAVLKDMKGMMHLGEFTHNYVKFTRNASAMLLDEAVEDLCSLVPDDALESLNRLRQETGAEFCIISCGTVNLIDRYLVKMNVGDVFGNRTGKVFDTTGDRLASVEISVRTPQDKVRVLNDEIKRIEVTTGTRPLTIAVGDGPTDIPMLQNSDLGVLIDWDKRPDEVPERQGFPLAGSVDEVCELIHNWLVDHR